MAAKLDVQRDWSTLRQFLPENYAQLAIEHEAMQLKYKDARIPRAGVLLRMIFLHLAADLPLRQTVAESGGPVVSPYCLHIGMRRAALFLQELVARVRAACTGKIGRWAGYELAAIDASSFAGRCANSTPAFTKHFTSVISGSFRRMPRISQSPNRCGASRASPVSW